MTLTQHIFNALSFLRPWSSSDEPPAAIPRIYRYIVDTWIRRPLAPLISVTLLATLTLRLVKMAYFLPPKNMFPSHRPERGGTSREQGYWEQMEKEGKQRPRRRMTDSQYSVGDVSVDSSHISRWNVPRDVSQDQSRGLPEQPLSVVPATSKPSSPPIDVLPDRSWSWSPHNGSEEQISVTKVGGFLQSNYDRSTDARRSSLGIQTETAAGKERSSGKDLLRARRTKARRRERRSLRESGDYLGVQGVNPHTGELDIVSPSGSSAGSSASHHETPRRILRTWRDVLMNHKSRDSPSRDDAVEDDGNRIARSLRGKKKVRELGKAVRWKRRGRSSLQEPDLSPIAQSLKSVSLSSRRPSHAQHLPQAIQQPTAVSTGEPLLDVEPSHAHSSAFDAPDNYIAASSPAVTPPTRTSSNSTVVKTPRRQSLANPPLVPWEFLESGSGLDDSGSQTSPIPTTQSENKSFLDMEAERNVKKSCTEASKAALSATQPTQSIPASGRTFERRFSLPGTMGMTPPSPYLGPSVFREPPPLILLEESPLGAMSQRRTAETRLHTRALRRRWDHHRRLRDVRAASTEAVKDPMEGIPNIPGGQASTGPPQEESVTMRLPAGSRHRHRRFTKTAIERDLLKLKEGVAMVDKQRLEQPHHCHNQTLTEHEQTSSVLREITDQAREIEEPASIPTITITGYNHQTSLSPFLLDGSIDPDLLLPLTVARQDESTYSALAVTSFGNSSGEFHSDPSMSSKQSPTSSAEAKMGDEPQAGTTFLEQEIHKMQLTEVHWGDRRTAKATMPAPEDDSSRKSTFTQDRMLQAVNRGRSPSAVNPEMQPSVTEKEANPVDHQMQIHNLPEEHRVYQGHQDEDDTASLLLKEANTDEAKALDAVPGEKEEDELEDEDGEQPTPLQLCLRYLKDGIRLYWATVWPMLDPRTLRVVNDGPMPLWKSILLIALTVPAAALAYVVVVEGTRFVMLMSWLLEFVDDESAI
ncbi:hypothetical protein V8C34DRAFT_323450 [Trichoderma compactum]